MSRMLQFAWGALVPKKPVPGRTVLEPSVRRMRVLPQDLDIMMHVNNGSYLQIMDVARFQFVAEGGALRLSRQNSWMPVVAASTLRYRRPLKLWNRFEVTSRNLAWDDRYFYMEQKITRNDKLYTRGIVAMRILHIPSREGVAPDDIVAALAEAQGYPDGAPASPELPEEALALARTLKQTSHESRPPGSA